MSRMAALLTVVVGLVSLAAGVCTLAELTSQRPLRGPAPVVPAAPQPQPAPAPTPDPAPAKPVLCLVVVSASWCGPCRQLHAELDAHGQTLRDAGVSWEILTDDRAAVKRYEVDRYPTILFLRDGKEVARRTGYSSAADLAAWVAAH